MYVSDILNVTKILNEFRIQIQIFPNNSYIYNMYRGIYRNSNSGA